MKNIIELWMTNSESYILMKFVEAQCLKNIIDKVSYEQKMLILMSLMKAIQMCRLYKKYCYLLINNIYLNQKLEVKLIDCILMLIRRKSLHI